MRISVCKRCRGRGAVGSFAWRGDKFPIIPCDECKPEAYAAWKAISEGARCEVTGNLYGTDTIPVGYSCECETCQRCSKARQSTFAFDR